MDDRTVTVSFYPNDGINCPTGSISLNTEYSPKDLLGILQQHGGNDDQNLESVAFDIKGIPLTESLRDTIDECINAGISDVNYEKVIPISVWRPYQAPSSSYNIKTPAWNLGIYADDNFVCAARNDGGVAIYKIPDNGKKMELFVERVLLVDENAKYSKHTKSSNLEPASHRCLDAFFLNNFPYLIIGGQHGQLCLATVSKDDGDIQMKIKNQCVGHDNDVTDVRFHPDRTHYASVDDSGLLKVWSLDDSNFATEGKEKKGHYETDDINKEGIKIAPSVTLDVDQAGNPISLSCLRWLPYDKHKCVTTGLSPYFYIVDSTTAKIEKKDTARALLRIDVSQNDGRIIASALDNNIRIYDLRSNSGAVSFVPDVGGIIRDAQWLNAATTRNGFAAIIDDNKEPVVAFYDSRFADTPIRKRKVFSTNSESQAQKLLRLAASENTLAIACDCSVQVYQFDDDNKVVNDN